MPRVSAPWAARKIVEDDVDNGGDVNSCFPGVSSGEAARCVGRHGHVNGISTDALKLLSVTSNTFFSKSIGRDMGPGTGVQLLLRKCM